MTADSASIVLLGSLSHFTLHTLKSLLRKKCLLNGIVIAGYPPSQQFSANRNALLFGSSPPEILQLARSRDIPVLFFINDVERLADFLTARSADIFILSCYPRKLPASVISIARSCCLNIHPSRLPKYRGADPIFWQLKSGEADTGVSIHKVTDSLDAGDTLLSESVPYPVGARLAEIQAVLIESAVDSLQSWLKAPVSDWRFEPQNQTESNWNRVPCGDDFSISTEAGAKVAFSFARAYADRNAPLKIIEGDATHLVQDAIRYDASASNTAQIIENGRVSVRFSDGRVVFLLNSRA